MPRIDVVVQSPVVDSFRVRQVDGLFDLEPASRSRLHFSAELPGLDERWTIGAIVGPSGSGKTVLARQAYAQGDIAHGAMVRGFDWPVDRAVVDGFDDELEGSRITRMLSLVGFSSPPAWRRPWHVLSQGQQFRCDLARALLLPDELVVMDEFTSVVDRQAARFGATAVSRAIRTPPGPARQVRCKRFVAASCHHDILDWLCPDWYLDTATGKLHWGSVQRPTITLQLCRAHQQHWPMFAHHHYLSASLNPAARCYLALWHNRPVAFCATMYQSATAPRRRVHRLVVLPDYQGMGIGPAVLDQVAQLESVDGSQVSIVTSHPALIRTLGLSHLWRRMRTKRCGQVHSGFLRKLGRAIGSTGRATASFLYQPADQGNNSHELQINTNHSTGLATIARVGNAQGRDQLQRHRQRNGHQRHPGDPRLQACSG